MKTQNPKYWLACSGGVDSVVLAHLLSKCNMNFGILHCNFQLRGDDSKADELFVKNLAIELNCPFRLQVFDTEEYGKQNRLNTQLAARELRYHWFNEIIEKEQAIIFLGHHKDDQIETFFLQLRRGGKVKGLAGMPEYHNGYLRPLLKYGKNELIELAEKHNWKWREDKSNLKNDYLRNQYRNEIIPLLSQQNFPVADSISLVHQFQKVLQFFRRFPLSNEIIIQDWFALPKWYKHYLISEIGLGEFPVKEIDRLAHATKGKFLGNDLVNVWNEGDKLVFAKNSSQSDKKTIETEILEPNNQQSTKTELFIDASKLTGSLYTRKWKAGDYFQPIGLKGKKTIGKFLRDRKVSSHLKKDIWILVTEQEEVVGIFGFGVAENYKITSHTDSVMKVKLI